MSYNNERHLLNAITRLTNVVIFLVALVVVLFVLLLRCLPDFTAVKEPVSELQPDTNGLFTEEARAAFRKKAEGITWKAPDVSSLEGNPDKELILYGRSLIAHTSAFFGPHGAIRHSTNGMNCRNCHLEAGTRIWGNNYSAVAANYPKYRSRSGTKESIFKRINDCFERSLNGMPLDTTSREMLAMAAYIRWVGSEVPKNTKPKGAGFVELSYLDRAADSSAGRKVYAKKCAVCHQPDGEGLAGNGDTAYRYPPLWGRHSYNTGAGLFRISNFAKFVRVNMPFVVIDPSMTLTDEEAWDVAAFVNSQPRPHKVFSGDWPNIAGKPVDHPFGPYADNFSEVRHKFGPYGPIAEFYKHNKRTR
jgi:thiosulfate dehydrogenase